MDLDERRRHDLFLACEQSLGPEPTETLMALLPPVGWADVATKTDLAQLEERIALRFDVIDQRFEMIDHRFEMIDHRFQTVDQGFQTVEQHLEHRIGTVEQHLEHRVGTVEQNLEHRIGTVELQLTNVRNELVAALHEGLNAQTKTLFFGIITVLTGIAAVVISVAR